MPHYMLEFIDHPQPGAGPLLTRVFLPSDRSRHDALEYTNEMPRPAFGCIRLVTRDDARGEDEMLAKTCDRTCPDEHGHRPCMA